MNSCCSNLSSNQRNGPLQQLLQQQKRFVKDQLQLLPLVRPEAAVAAAAAGGV